MRPFAHIAGGVSRGERQLRAVSLNVALNSTKEELAVVLSVATSFATLTR